jgi:alpha-D-ribose 1-methylphosphonate 5-triphosphate synthase subunit PhnG
VNPLQNNDAGNANDATHALTEARREWMAVLAKSPLPLLESWAEMLNKSMNNSMNKSSPYSFVWLRRPEVGLTMARARIGGTGNRFNFGELTVTRCALRLASGQHGVAYVPNEKRNLLRWPMRFCKTMKRVQM